jgi:glutamyl-tRNA reductase
MVGLQGDSAPVALREEALARLPQSRSPGIVVLATCYRIELYFSGTDLEREADRWSSLFGHRGRLSLGNSCFFHLAKVASGLDSPIVAETEILGQVKKAYADAAKRGPLPAPLHFGFQKALRVAKQVRSTLRAPSGSEQIARVVWELAQREGREGGRLLLIGQGTVTRAVGALFGAQQRWTIELASRFPAGKVDGVVPVGWGAVERWHEYDVVVTASRAGLIIQGPRPTPRAPLLFDLAVPRNIDPAIDAPLYDIEQIIERIEVPLLTPHKGAEGQVRAHAERLLAGYAARSPSRLSVSV